ncbi:MAG: hypothetical protein WCA20_13275 [Candidatus Sulfotelmatobacter sp.]
MATAGEIIASAVAEEEATSPAVETAVAVLLQPIADAPHQRCTLAIAAAALTPQQRMVMRPMVRPTPRQRMVAPPMVRPTPQQRMAVAPLTAADRMVAAADRMVAANTINE